MDHTGIDVHKRGSQICILAEGGELIERRIRTEPERFAAVLGGRPRARIVIEASTDSEWVARCLETLGRGHRCRPELRPNVRHAHAQGEDRSPTRAPWPTPACSAPTAEAHRLPPTVSPTVRLYEAETPSAGRKPVRLPVKLRPASP
jgi:hypothetical protein